jgi:four helix bundle protein
MRGFLAGDEPVTEEKKAPRASSARFEDLEVWQAARLLVRDIYPTSSAGGYVRDFGLRDQTRRSAVSVMSNIAEGFERDGNKELLQFLALAKGSCGELRSQLYVAADQGYLPPEESERQCQSAARISRMISGFMKYLRSSEMRGRNPAPRSSSLESGISGVRSPGS